jgi:DNA-binding MarR family transcriptional regulator
MPAQRFARHHPHGWNSAIFLESEQPMRRATCLDACNCFAARQAARHITRLYERHLSEAELTSAQFAILAILAETPETTMSELAEALVMDRTTLLRATRPLQRDRLIVNKPTGKDSRRLVFSLSGAGQRKLKDARRHWQNAQRQFEAEVGPTRAARIRRDLLTIARPD